MSSLPLLNNNKITIAFHIQHFDYRGTGDVVYNYAHYNETVLKNQSVIVISKQSLKNNYEIVIDRYMSRFPIYIYEDLNELQQYCLNNNVTHFYALKYGKNDGIVLQPPIKNLIHCVYTTSESHGDGKYFGVSETIDSKEYLYHIVKMNETKQNLRARLNIPENAVVFGRHGGTDTFLFPGIIDVIKTILDTYENVHFVFMPQPDILKQFEHPRIHHLPPTVNPEFKRKFINTVDAMLHCSLLGESFGLSVLEFSYCNKPVITFNGGKFVDKENTQHLKFLGDKALTYNNTQELLSVLKNFLITTRENVKKDWRTPILDQLTPEKIMQKFKLLLENNDCNDNSSIINMLKNYKGKINYYD